MIHNSMTHKGDTSTVDEPMRSVFASIVGWRRRATLVPDDPDLDDEFIRHGSIDMMIDDTTRHCQ